MASLSGALSGGLQVPSVQLGHAMSAPCPVNIVSCSNYWTPAGPAMDTENAVIFTDGVSELTGLQSLPPTIDLPDTPLSPTIIPGLINSPSFAVTSVVSQHAYYDIQFLLVNNFWGCDFNFGNSKCGAQIRQGISHMIDKSAFVANDPSIAGLATALDNPEPPNNGGLLSPNPCAWDSSFSQTGSNCIVGSSGGTSYHLGTAAGANGFIWLQAPGSPDLNAAAQHFVNAGVASGFNPATSVLTGINASAAIHVVNFFIRNDDSPRLDLGNGLAGEICYLFTGSYAFPCTYLSTTRGPSTAFPGFATCDRCISLSWWMYTGTYTDVFPFDSSLYFTYNSRFVSGIPPIVPPVGPCAAGAPPSLSGANYVYLCSPVYDSISNQMEFANCLTTTGDPVGGSTNNNSTGTCPGGGLSSVGAGLRAEDFYGKNAYSVPVFDRNEQFAYLSNWQNVINGDGVGVPNYFTWLDAYSPNPAVPGTVRQGFSQTTRSVSPYIAETSHDFYIVRNVYDSFTVRNPLSNGQLVDWMGFVNTNPLPPGALPYLPPPGTVETFRFTLRNDLFFHDGRKVTSFDVAFSYLSLMATGAFQSAGLAPITGITILGPTQFDVNLNGVGPFTLGSLTSPTIIPGRYWTSGGSAAWDASTATCTSMGASCYIAQYTLSTNAGPVACAFTCTFPAALMNVNPAQIGAAYDPIASHTFVGSGPFTCGTVTSSGSGICASPSNIENAPIGGSYTLTRFGKGLQPASTLDSIYFRSSGNLALYFWSQDTGDFSHDFLNFSVVASCFGSTSPRCNHWMMGIGGCGGTTTNTCTVGLAQVSIVNRFIGTNWVAPFNWFTLPPAGIIPPLGVLHEGGSTFNPASLAGCSAPYPSGGYDC